MDGGLLIPEQESEKIGIQISRQKQNELQHDAHSAKQLEKVEQTNLKQFCLC